MTQFNLLYLNLFLIYRLFNEDETKRLENLTLYDMLMSITEMDWNDIPRDSFRVSRGKKYVQKY